MSILNHKIDFAVIFSVNHANPNGDPLMDNRPRMDSDGIGFITDVCLKRKIRNRMQDFGSDIYVQSDERATDACTSLQERAEAYTELIEAAKDQDAARMAELACKKWADVRTFGNLFAFSTKKGKKGDSDANDTHGVSMGIRGPVTIQYAYSTAPIDIEDSMIVKSVNGTTTTGKSSDRMGHQYQVPFAIYVAYGSINSRLAEKTGFSEEDAAMVRKCLESLFENDESSTRPSGSMEVLQVIWWTHSTRDAAIPSGRVHRSLEVRNLVDSPKSVEDIELSCKKLNGVTIETMDGGLPVNIA